MIKMFQEAPLSPNILDMSPTQQVQYVSFFKKNAFHKVEQSASLNFEMKDEIHDSDADYRGLC